MFVHHCFSRRRMVSYGTSKRYDDARGSPHWPVIGGKFQFPDFPSDIRPPLLQLLVYYNGHRLINSWSLSVITDIQYVDMSKSGAARLPPAPPKPTATASNPHSSPHIIMDHAWTMAPKAIRYDDTLIIV